MTGVQTCGLPICWLTAKMIDLPISPLIGSRSAFLEDLIGGFGKEAFLKLALLVDLLLLVAFVILELDDEAILGKKLGCDLAAGIHKNRVDQEAVFHSIQ